MWVKFIPPKKKFTKNQTVVGSQRKKQQKVTPKREDIKSQSFMLVCLHGEVTIVHSIRSSFGKLVQPRVARSSAGHSDSRHMTRSLSHFV
jgi:hypothetical protein